MLATTAYNQIRLRGVSEIMRKQAREILESEPWQAARRPAGCGRAPVLMQSCNLSIHVGVSQTRTLIMAGIIF